MKLYVGNLPPEVSADDLLKLFEKHGWVDSVEIVKEDENGKSMGFGFVIMSTFTDAQKAIEGLNDKENFGRVLDVHEDRRDRLDRREFTERRSGAPRRKLSDRRQSSQRRDEDNRRHDL